MREGREGTREGKARTRKARQDKEAERERQDDKSNSRGGCSIGA